MLLGLADAAQETAKTIPDNRKSFISYLDAEGRIKFPAHRPAQPGLYKSANHNEDHQPDEEKHEEKNLGDPHGSSGYAGETQKARDQRYNQKYK